MFEIYDLMSGASLLSGFSTVSAARSAAFRIYRDRMWAIRSVQKNRAQNKIPNGLRAANVNDLMRRI